jgi:hypothetical protein
MNTAVTPTTTRSTARGRSLRRMQLRLVAGTTGAALLLPVAPLLALARPDPGSPAPGSSQQTVRGLDVSATAQPSCPLRRVGAQLVRCDDLTGNGVPAPTTTPERR